jgi:hypothetical protein
MHSDASVGALGDSVELLAGGVDQTNELALVNINDSVEELCLLIEEAGCRGVLDSACSKTVAGLKWIEQYTSSVSPTFADSLEVATSSKVYQFGGGEKRTSYGCLKLPTVIGEKKVLIATDMVDASIPMLIGSNAMVNGEAVLDFKSNIATFFGEEVPMFKGKHWSFLYRFSV